MKDMGKVMKEYGKIDISELAMRFQHPLIRRSITDYMPSGYQAYAFLVSYATVTSGNGDIPKGGSLAMAMRIADKYRELGGILHTNSDVWRIILNGRKASGIPLRDETEITADYIICACDTDYTFRSLLPDGYMPKQLKKQYEQRKKYPVNSGFQIAYAVDGQFPALTGTRIFSCEEFEVDNHKVNHMSIQSYDYEPDFTPDGKIHILDVWTPMTYTRYCNSYQGAYMSFVNTKHAKSITTPGIIKGLDNVMLASQWLMGPGGLPTAAAMGKFAAWRIIQKEGK